MRLQLATWVEVDDYLKRSRGIIMPIGSTEQHGPTGLIGTDAITAEAIAQRIGDRLGVFVAPTIAVGMAQHHLGFAGSMSLRPSTLIAVIHDMVLSLARHGFARFFFINGHGGNIATVTASFSELYAEASFAAPGANTERLRCKLKNWWETRGVKRFCDEHYGAADGTHATASEVAVTQFVYPDHIKKAVLDPPQAPPGHAFYDAADYRRRFPDGRMGSNPGLATPEDGGRLVDIAVEDIAAEYTAFAAAD